MAGREKPGKEIPMVTLIDTSVWVDFFRAATPVRVREEARQSIVSPDAATCEPVIFELLRSCPSQQRPMVQAHLATTPTLPTPASLWAEAARLGQWCHDKGCQAGALDLLIASLCIHHGAEIITFDADFGAIAKFGPLKVRLLGR